MTSLADYLAGVATGVAAVVATIALGALAVHRKAREVDAWFTRTLDPIPSHVKIVEAECRGLGVTE